MQLLIHEAWIDAYILYIYTYYTPLTCPETFRDNAERVTRRSDIEHERYKGSSWASEIVHTLHFSIPM